MAELVNRIENRTGGHRFRLPERHVDAYDYGQRILLTRLKRGGASERGRARRVARFMQRTHGMVYASECGPMDSYHLFPDGIHWTLVREHDERLFLFESEEDALAGCSEFMRESPGTLKMHLGRDTVGRELSGAVQQAA